MLMMNSNLSSDKSASVKVSHARIGSAESKCIWPCTSCLLSCAQVFCDDRHSYCSAESFQCLWWTPIWVLTEVLLSKCLMLVLQQPNPTAFGHAHHAYWVVLKYSVMTGTIIAVQSHFNAYNELQFEFWQKCFCQSVSCAYRSSRIQMHLAMHIMLIELCSSIL